MRITQLCHTPLKRRPDVDHFMKGPTKLVFEKTTPQTVQGNFLLQNQRLMGVRGRRRLTFQTTILGKTRGIKNVGKRVNDSSGLWISKVFSVPEIKQEYFHGNRYLTIPCDVYITTILPIVCICLITSQREVSDPPSQPPDMKRCTAFNTCECTDVHTCGQRSFTSLHISLYNDSRVL